MYLHICQYSNEKFTQPIQMFANKFKLKNLYWQNGIKYMDYRSFA